MATYPVVDLSTALAFELRVEKRLRDLTYDDIAAASGVNVRQVKRYLSGERGLNLDTAETLIQAIGVDPYLVYRRARARLEATRNGSAVVPVFEDAQRDYDVAASAEGSQTVTQTEDDDDTTDSPAV